MCLPLCTIITPATLNENVVLQHSSEKLDIATLQISNPKLFREFGYTVNATRSGDLQRFLGVRTILTRLAVAAAANGEIVQLSTPSTNSTYEQTFYGPVVKCLDAPSTIAAQIDTVSEEHKVTLGPDLLEVSNDYFAYVPVTTHANSTPSYLLTADLVGSSMKIHTSNQILLRFSRYNGTNNSVDNPRPFNPHYLVCELRNSSYHVNFTWSNGQQSFPRIQITTLNPVLQTTNITNSDADLQGIAYSAFMRAFSSQIVGHLSFYRDVGPTNDTDENVKANRPYSKISTNLAQTTLLGSCDLNNFFIKNHALGKNEQPSELFSARRLNDIKIARNRTLDVLIEELSFNVTMSLITNPRFAPSVPTNVTVIRAQTTYVYSPQPLLLTYGLALSFSFLAVCLGLFAYWSNGVSHDNAFFSIVSTTRGVHFSDLEVHERLGALPLDKKLARAELVFRIPGQSQPESSAERRVSEGGGLGFRIVLAAK